MRKVFSVLMIAVLTFCLCSCSSAPSPTETVDQYLKAYKAKDVETMQTVYSGEAQSFNESEFAGYGDLVVEKILEFDYAITEEKIDGEKATVKVDLTTYPMGNAFEAATEEMILAALESSFGDLSEEEASERSLKALNKEFEKLDKKTYKATCVIDLTLVDDVWMIDEIKDGSSFSKAVFGGMIEATEQWNFSAN